MKRLLMMAVFALVFVTTPAQAAGMYVSGNAGLSLVPDLEQDVVGGGFAGPIFDISTDPGFGIIGALGYDFGTFRAEGEIAYRLNDLDVGMSLQPPILTAPFDGDISALSFMANGYYDYHLTSSPFVPYVGVGLGVAIVSAEVTVPALSSLPLIDDSAAVFAYQFMAGLGYNISPMTTLTLDYRYFATTDPEFDREAPPFNPAVGNIESTYSNHLISVGIRYTF